MAEHAREELEVLESEIKANLCRRALNTIAFLRTALKRLRQFHSALIRNDG